MTKQRPITESDEPLTLEGIFKRIASGISDAGADRETLSVAEQWKLDLTSGAKTRMDLIAFLAEAPGRPEKDQSMDPDIPVPWYEPGEKAVTGSRRRGR